MPYVRRHGKRAYKPRKRIVRRRKPLSRASVLRQPRGTNAPFAQRKFCKLTYFIENGRALTPGAALSAHIFRTSLYDPNFSHTGHQQMYRDQLFTIYTFGRIHGVSYDLTFFNNTNNEYAQVIIFPGKDSSVTSLSAHEIQEQANARTLALTDQRLRKVKGYFSVPRIQGLSKQAFKSQARFTESISGTAPDGGNPIWTYLHLVGVSHSGSTLSIPFSGKLTFYVEFHERELVNTS